MAAIERIDTAAYVIPTDGLESDGTYEWNETCIVIVEVFAGGTRGLGYTYADRTAAELAGGRLAKAVLGRDGLDLPAAWAAMVHQVRNLGRPGICSMAIAAVDAALWDLKARLLGVPLVKLLGAARDSAPAYGSGGFTSYSEKRLQQQLAGWVAEGLSSVKMKIGREPDRDLQRVRLAREAIGDAAGLYVDANGAYGRKQALGKAHEFAALGVSWFEEPVSSDDLEGLRLLRDHGPPGMDIAAGEYGFDLAYFHRMLSAGAVDVLQADATRCTVTDFLRAGALCSARGLRLSAHTAPSLHTHLCCAMPGIHSVEYFYDHVRIEEMIFDGAIKANRGVLRPDLSRPGMGLELKRADAERYGVCRKSSGGNYA